MGEQGQGQKAEMAASGGWANDTAAGFRDKTPEAKEMAGVAGFDGAAGDGFDRLTQLCQQRGGEQRVSSERPQRSWRTAWKWPRRGR
jgi:hypothetical protein